MNVIENNIVSYVQSSINCSAQDILAHLNKEMYVSKTTLYWYLNKLTKENKISRIARGHYAKAEKKPFIPEVNERMKQVNDLLKKALPFASFCFYQGSELSPYLHNIATNNILYVETERDSCETVFNILREQGLTVYVRPDKEMIYHYIDLAGDAIFVKALTSESPVFVSEGITVPTLEKLLVDIRVDEDFFYLQGSEAFYVLRNAAERNIINVSKMMRYARRRHIDSELKKDLEEICVPGSSFYFPSRKDYINLHSMVSSSVHTMLPKIQAVLAQQPVVKAWLFGSYSRGEETPQSDVDILVQYDENARITLLTISRIMTRLSDAVGKKVDLVEDGCLLPFAQQSAERDKILIYERAS